MIKEIMIGSLVTVFLAAWFYLQVFPMLRKTPAIQRNINVIKGIAIGLLASVFFGAYMHLPIWFPEIFNPFITVISMMSGLVAGGGYYALKDVE